MRTALAELLAEDSPPPTADVVIVGAGIAGLALACELVRTGTTSIVLVDRGYPGSGATGRNVARIRAMQLTEPLTRLAVACQAKYERMADELRFNVLFYRLGYAWLLYEAHEVERMRTVVAMHHRLGVRSALLGPDETLRRLPILEGGEPVAGAVLNDDAIVHHDAVVWAHLEHLAGRGPQLLPATEVVGVERDGQRVTGVRTTRGSIATRVVVNATAAWSGDLNRAASVAFPNRPYRREVLVTAPMRRAIEAAVTFYLPVEGWFNQTLRGEIVMGAVDPDEPAAVNQQSSLAFLRRTASTMVAKAPALADVPVIRQWAGMYDVSPDHLPLVGPTQQLEGWWQAVGWSGRGMLLAPYLMQLLAPALAGRPMSADLLPFDPDRFGAADPDAVVARDYYARYAAKD